LNQMKPKMRVMSYIILSITGAVLIIIMSLSSSNMNNIPFFDKLFVGVVFMSSCILGISFALRPNWLKGLAKRESSDVNKRQTRTTARKRQGHHPECMRFKGHTIIIKNKIFCAGCLGLATGSIISIFFMVIYIFLSSEISSKIFPVLIFPGMILVAINYMETAITMRNAALHVISNIFLVIGFFFVVTGILQLTGSIIYGVFGIIISFLWLDTRIQLSNFRHAGICKDCTEDCKAY